MNRKKIITVAILFLLMCACLFCGCAEYTPLTIEGVAGKYDWVYEQEFIDEYDSYMTIDGKATEELWQNKVYFEHSEHRDDKTINLRVTSAFTTKGVYIYGEADDSTIEHNGRFTITENSGFTILIAGSDVNRRWRMECLRLDLDAKNCRSWGQHRVAGKTTVEGEIGSANTTKMTMEMFISWRALLNEAEMPDAFDENGDLKESAIPENIKIYPKYRQIIKKGETQSIYKIMPTFTDKEWVAMYHYFDANGYTQGEREDSDLGNAQNGLSKTAAWNLTGEITEEGQKKIESVAGRGNQAIYFKNVFAENFVLESDVTPGDAITNLAGNVENGQFGLIAQKSFSEFRAVHLKTSGGGTGFKDGKITISAMTYWPNRFQTTTWGIVTKSNEDFGLATDATTVNMKMIKIGGNLAIFINGKIAYQEYCSYLEDACAPGLYTYYNDVAFSNYSAKALSDEEVDSYLAELGLSRIVITNKDGQPITAGGSIQPNSFLYHERENVELTLEPKTGYVLSEFLVNGVDCYEAICSGIEGGKYTVDRSEMANGKIEIIADYQYVATKDTRKNVKGEVVLGLDERFGGNRILSNIPVHVEAVNNPQFYFDTVSDQDGKFDINLCVGGTLLPKDKTIAETDNYILTFIFNGHTYQKTISLTQDYDDEQLTVFMLGKDMDIGTINSTAPAQLATTGNEWKYGTASGVLGIWLAASSSNSTGIPVKVSEYDAIRFSLDTTKVPAGKTIPLFFQLRSLDGNSRFAPRAVYALTAGTKQAQALNTGVYSSTNNSSCLHFPAGFKGDILILFEDFTMGNAGALLSDANRQVQSKFWVIADSIGLQNVEMTVGNAIFVDYGKVLLEGYGRSIAAPSASTANITASNGTYTFKNSFSGVEWLLAGAKVAINHKNYDALTFDVDTTQTNGKEVKLAIMFKNEKEQDNTRATFAYAIAEDGSVQKLEYRQYAGYTDNQIAIPANFKGKIVVLFKDVNYHDSTHAVGTSIEAWNGLCSAIWLPMAGVDMAGAVFTMNNFSFVTNGAELVGLA